MQGFKSGSLHIQQHFCAASVHRGRRRPMLNMHAQFSKKHRGFVVWQVMLSWDSRTSLAGFSLLSWIPQVALGKSLTAWTVGWEQPLGLQSYADLSALKDTGLWCFLLTLQQRFPTWWATIHQGNQKQGNPPENAKPEWVSDLLFQLILGDLGSPADASTGLPTHSGGWCCCQVSQKGKTPLSLVCSMLTIILISS